MEHPFYRRWALIPREFKYLEKKMRSSELQSSGRNVGVCSKWLLRFLNAKERRIKKKKVKKKMKTRNHEEFYIPH